MNRRASLWVPVLALLPCLVAADDIATLEDLRRQHPYGVPWSIEFTDETGRSLGRLNVLITDRPADSCLGSFGKNAVRVAFLDMSGRIRRLLSSPYGVADVSSNNVQIDLTGNMCDAYLLMSGELLPDGSSSGEFYSLDLAGKKSLGTYHATVE